MAPPSQTGRAGKACPPPSGQPGSPPRAPRRRSSENAPATGVRRMPAWTPSRNCDEMRWALIWDSLGQIFLLAADLINLPARIDANAPNRDAARGSSQHAFHDFAVHVRQPEFAPLILERQLRV